ncbi:MAG: membrane protein insertion efficiency factor YidD [Candidatus Omnitrophota bacterium]
MRLSFLTRFIINLINLYQIYISSSLPNSCRFYPSCSEYAKQAFLKYGLVIGMVIALGRLIKCHPFSGSQGFNPLN